MTNRLKTILDKYTDEDNITEELDIPSMKKQLQDIMWNYVGIFRDENSLATALKKLNDLKSKLPRTSKCISREEYEFRDMLIVANLIANSALTRKESRGAHYRTDYTQTNEECVHSIITKEDKVPDYVK